MTMKILFVTNYPAPYRVAFFNLLGKKVDLTVVFCETAEEQHHRSAEWFDTDYKYFNPIFLKKKRKIGKWIINTDVIKELKNQYDCIIMAGYSNPTFIYAIEYMRIHNIPFLMEIDGGLIKKDRIIQKAIKKHLISSASGWISSGEVSDRYLLHYGADAQNIYHYPFSSLLEADIENAANNTIQNKTACRKKLLIKEQYAILCIGQFIYRKGIDVLLKAAALIDKNIGIYIIGGDPTEDYLKEKEKHELSNVHFVGFQRKDELKQFFIAADALVMPTREDIWGLVVNEALCYGLPIVSTDKCVAALELVKNGYNGWIVPAENPEALSIGINQIIEGNLEELSQNARESIFGHSIEGMVSAHMELFQSTEMSGSKN